ncbi:HAAS domain-containing protein [Thalassobacillus hwangdonensis]|uniref:HAAS domain-containing protein n=1 Tax=Thalassobacillus hwangdonensis TaxID=546108 RepID=UPI0036DC34C0
MTNEGTLSPESKKFLENLRVYLFSSGKNSAEIDGIVEELEDHLLEAERNGKPIEKIIGNSPKEYMEMVSEEMVVDYRAWMKYICLILLGAFSITVFPDLLKGNLSYSVLEIVGHIVIGVIFIGTVFAGFKYLSTGSQSGVKHGIVLGVIAAVPMLLFLSLFYLDQRIETPMVQFGSTGTLVIGIVTSLVMIGMSIWAKTWLLLIIVLFLTLPDYILKQTSMTDETQLIISSLVTLGGIGLYLLISSKLEKEKVNHG